MSYLVLVSGHALDRAYERWPAEAIGVGTIRAEVLEALHGGRVSARKPPRFENNGAGKVLYTWTSDGRRAHVLRASPRAFHVLTLLDASTRAEAA